MSKRVDHDATQEVSASMLVPDKKPPVYPNVPKNDASMWLSAPVSADDFVSGPKKKPELRGNRSFVILVFLALVVLLVGGAAFAWYAFLRPTAEQPSPVANTPPPAPGDKAIAAAPPSDAAVAIAPADAAVAATDDAVAAAGALVVDAVSAADPAPKQTAKKRPATKKRVVKKKTASTRKRR